MARREYGDGSIYQRQRDGRWCATLEAGWTAKGTRRRVTVTAKTRAEVVKKLRDKKLQVERDGLTASARATVKTWAPTWLTMIERHLAPQAYVSNRSAMSRWIIPTIGHKRFDQLTPADVRAVDEAQRAANLASSSIRRNRSVLNTFLRAALSEGLPVAPRLLEVKTSGKKGRRSATNDREAMTVPEAVAVLEQAAQIPHGSRYVAAFLQGLRQGESLGMTWDEIDLDNHTWRVSWQLQPLKYKQPRDRSSGFRLPDDYEAIQAKGALHLVRPKSDAGWRVHPLVPWMHSALTAWREIAPTSPHGLVWTTPDGEPIYYKRDDADWYALQDAAGVRHPSGRHYTTHEARHTTATLLLEAGVAPEVIIAILGHSTILTSRGYMHVNQAPARAALEKVAERLQPG